MELTCADAVLALARNVFTATDDDLRVWHTSRQLHAVRTSEAVVGLLAVAPGRVGWIEGNEITEEVIAVEHQGHGYAAIAQAAWAAHVTRDQSQLIIGTIDRLNISSRKTARAACRTVTHVGLAVGFRRGGQCYQ